MPNKNEAEKKNINILYHEKVKFREFPEIIYHLIEKEKIKVHIIWWLTLGHRNNQDSSLILGLGYHTIRFLFLKKF